MRAKHPCPDSSTHHCRAYACSHYGSPHPGPDHGSANSLRHASAFTCPDYRSANSSPHHTGAHPSTTYRRSLLRVGQLPAEGWRVVRLGACQLRPLRR